MEKLIKAVQVLGVSWVHSAQTLATTLATNKAVLDEAAQEVGAGAAKLVANVLMVKGLVLQQGRETFRVFKGMKGAMKAGFSANMKSEAEKAQGVLADLLKQLNAPAIVPPAAPPAAPTQTVEVVKLEPATKPAERNENFLIRVARSVSGNGAPNP